MMYDRVPPIVNHDLSSSKKVPKTPATVTKADCSSPLKNRKTTLLTEPTPAVKYIVDKSKFVPPLKDIPLEVYLDPGEESDTEKKEELES
mgnify:CR=1 FL=1|jgi:hypothetical protein